MMISYMRKSTIEEAMKEKLSSILVLLNVCFPPRTSKKSLYETCGLTVETKIDAQYQNFVTMNNQMILTKIVIMKISSSGS